jgi:hypothetical protein
LREALGMGNIHAEVKHEVVYKLEFNKRFANKLYDELHEYFNEYSNEYTECPAIDELYYLLARLLNEDETIID